MSKRRLKSDDSEKEGGGKIYLMAGLVSLVAVSYFVYQVFVNKKFLFMRAMLFAGVPGD